MLAADTNIVVVAIFSVPRNIAVVVGRFDLVGRWSSALLSVLVGVDNHLTASAALAPAAAVEFVADIVFEEVVVDAAAVVGIHDVA